MKIVGIQALITLVTYVGFIGISFWSIQELHIERYIPMRAAQGKFLIVLLAITIGYSSSSFFLSLIDNIRNLIYLIK